MRWLIDEFGDEPLRHANVILPTPEFFPDEFSEDESDVRSLLDRVCGYMCVDPERVKLEFFTDESHQLECSLPTYEYSHDGAAGTYRKRRGKFIIAIESSQTNDPMNLVATIAHELGHVRLLGEDRVDPDEDHEPLTDLLTVFLGMGVFTGNAAFSFTQWTNAFSQGWQAQRRGYLTEEMFGYALALFARVRGEGKPAWSKYLEGNVGAYFKGAHRFLQTTGDTPLKTLRAD